LGFPASLFSILQGGVDPQCGEGGLGRELGVGVCEHRTVVVALGEVGVVGETFTELVPGSGKRWGRGETEETRRLERGR
jgi:hypothetical protein